VGCAAVRCVAVEAGAVWRPVVLGRLLGASWTAYASEQQCEQQCRRKQGHSHDLGKRSTFGTDMGPQLLPPGTSRRRSSLPSAEGVVPADSMRLLTAAMRMRPSTMSAPRRTPGWCPAPCSFVTRSALIRRRRRTAGWRANVILRGPCRVCRRCGSAAGAASELVVAGAPLPQRGLPLVLADRQGLDAEASRLSDVAAASYRAEQRSDPPGEGRGGRPAASTSCAAAPSPGFLRQCQNTHCAMKVEPVSQPVPWLECRFPVCLAPAFNDEATDVSWRASLVTLSRGRKPGFLEHAPPAGPDNPEPIEHPLCILRTSGDG